MSSAEVIIEAAEGGRKEGVTREEVECQGAGFVWPGDEPLSANKTCHVSERCSMLHLGAVD